MENKSVFQTLSEIDVKPFIKDFGNNKLSYIPWSVCVREIAKRYPDFTWEFTKFDGVPYLATPTGFYVECSVTIGGLERKQMRPVYSFGNNANMEPRAGDIDKAQQRTLAKCIALHGFGLELWAGEDADAAELRFAAQEEKQAEQAKKQIDEAEKWKNETLPKMLAEYANFTTVKSVKTANTEHTRKAQMMGDKAAIAALAKAKDNRIEEIANESKENA